MQRLLGILARKIFCVWKSSRRIFFTGVSCNALENSVKSLVGYDANLVQRRVAHPASTHRSAHLITNCGRVRDLLAWTMDTASYVVTRSRARAQINLRRDWARAGPRLSELPGRMSRREKRLHPYF